MEISAREARRRRILDRGSDRLALISGRIQSLPSSSSSQPRDSLTASSQQSLSQDQEDVPTRHPSHQSNEFLKQETTNEPAGSATIINESSVSTQPPKCDTDLGNIQTPALDIFNKAQPSLSASAFPSSSTSSLDSDMRQQVEPNADRPRIFTANKISSSISVTENIRVLSSVTLALLVVLSHFSLPLLGSNIIKSVISSRPLYLLLLTDISIVLAPLILEQIGSKKPEEEEARKTTTKEGNRQAEAVGNPLEVALVLYKALSAAFMDCSIYAVVVICGFCLAQFWL